ncbi:MAG TPA: CTP synthase [Candidatus Gracilibacteria bacterium]
MKEPNYVFVTGGVCSSLGKGIVASSTAAILRSAGLNVAIMKLDPYLNVDPGTMSPFQHGEVFVLDDGSETDLDLGHYERFIDTPLSGVCTLTTGRVYSEVLNEEREGKYLGGTIQIVPHITGKILEKIEEAAAQMKVDILLVEIGGTVGDIEGQPFLEVLREMKLKYPKKVLSMHTTLLPYLAGPKELKTKPTQLSVRELRSLGIQPDAIFCRADIDIPEKILEKVAFFCDVPAKAVIPAQTVKSIYEVPLRFHKRKLGELVAEKFGYENLSFDLSVWEELNQNIKNAKEVLRIGLAGKYNELDDAYLSVIEAAKAAGFKHNRKVEIDWIDTEKIEEKDEKAWSLLKSVAGVIVPGGFGNRGIEGKVQVAKYCRENKKPYLGLCLGSQIMAMDFARHEVGIKGATSEEFDAKAPHQVIHFIPGQKKILQKGGTMRLGAYPCILKAGSSTAKLYEKTEISERHRHRYEFNNQYRDQLESKGFIIAGTSPDGELVEAVEIRDHPFMIGVQYHPEFLSRPFKPHPLFDGLIAAAK